MASDLKAKDHDLGGSRPQANLEVVIDPSLLKDVGIFVEDPDAWFHAPNEAFEGRAPIELLGTSEDFRLRNRIEAAKLGLFS